MSVAVMQSSSATFRLDQPSWPAPAERDWSEDDRPLVLEGSDEERPGQFDVWSAIQLQKAATAAADQPAAPYVHPLVGRSSSLLSQKSLEICTESLGSETGSDDFSSFMDDLDYCYPPKFDNEEKQEEKKYDYEQQVTAVVAEGAKVRAVEHGVWHPRDKELTSVNYHCSIGRRSPPRSFPPPLPSISRRNGPCFHMRPHRRDGRLVVEAVPVPSQNYLHAQRVDGRLLLSFIDTIFGDEPGYESDASDAADEIALPPQQEDAEQEKEYIQESEEREITRLEEKEEEELEEQSSYGQGQEEEELDEKNCYEEDEEEEEEEVEVLDRGTVVEVKVSTQPQQQSGAMKVHRSSLVINKFVGGMPLGGMTECERPTENHENTSNQNKPDSAVASAPAARRSSPTTTTAAAAVVAASTLSVATGGYNDQGYHGGLWSPIGSHQVPPLDNKLLFTSKRRNREELLHNMMRCGQLPWPLFIWEPCCIATSS